MKNDEHISLYEQNKVIEMIARDNLPLEEILAELIKTIDSIIPDIKSSILFFDKKTNTLGRGIGPKVPKGFLKEIDGLEVGPAAGSCGTAVYNKATVVVTDTLTDHLWGDFRQLCLKYNIRACCSKPIFSSENKVLGTLAFYYDHKRKPTEKEWEMIGIYANLAGLIITKKRLEEKLYLSNTVVEKSPVILMRWKAEQGWPVEYVSNNISRFGYSPEDFLSGKIMYDSIIHPEDLPRVEAEVQCHSENWVDDYTQEYRLYTKDGNIKWVDDRTIIERDGEGVVTHYQGAVLDITEKKEAAEIIHFLADNDPLTSLPNRRVFMEQLKAELEKVRTEEAQGAVLFLDLDNFKDVNDTMGHLYGDQLLRQVAFELSNVIEGGGIVSRVSGDEFAFIFKQAEVKVIDELAKNILRILQSPFMVEGKEFYITASIGVCQYPVHGRDADTLIARADMAMYQAKKTGKNKYLIYTIEMNESILKKKRLEREMNYALREDQFSLYYQPQIDLHTNEVVGVEALIRWSHPEWGEVSPDKFIPIAEETGLILEIDKWVLREACHQGAAWLKKGLPAVKISVNLSANQFYYNELVENVKGILEEVELPSSYLSLEMTEGTLLKDTKKTSEVLRALQNIGVQTSLDDFGTGYSSLSYLKDLPINILKLDRSFISGIKNDNKDAAIVQTILHLAKILELDVIAEGVEAEEQLKFLKQNHCLIAQGDYFSVPLTPGEMEKLLI
ncbi:MULTISPECIES: EAL domain-containing protein [Bacillaceae]|uniref:EAL domain-containing protein n=1 Tax=Evansella alkalicola TaxID=745819 RepID=A0ABS6JWP5_9BACI|nr:MULTISPECIES: EAL domain-containing protein [Bacillaceae]MBU9721545.1 EAL domain-containing protein [Bacillus alkalicola]